MKKKLINLNDNKVSEIEISDKIFGIKVYPDLIHQYIRYQNAKARQGRHKTKTRSEVKGKSKKPFAKKEQVMQGKEVVNHLILEEEQYQWVHKIEIIHLI